MDSAEFNESTPLEQPLLAGEMINQIKQAASDSQKNQVSKIISSLQGVTWGQQNLSNRAANDLTDLKRIGLEKRQMGTDRPIDLGVMSSLNMQNLGT
jgi:hypothetical protein